MTPTQFVKSGDINIAVYQWGKISAELPEKPVLVLIHGFPDTAALWQKVATNLSDRFHVVAYDVRGAGQSTSVNAFWKYGYKHLVRDLTAVLDAVSPNQPVHLVGHDWGALQGWDAIIAPHLQGRIASFSTAAPSLDQIGLWFRRRILKPTPRNLMQLGSQLFRNSFMLFFHLPLIPELFWRLGAGEAVMRSAYKFFENLDLQATPTLAGDGRRALGFYRANLLPHLLLPRITSSNLPIQALIAVDDAFVPPWLFENLEGAQNLIRSEIPGGHFSPLSQPIAFADAVAGFVTTVRAKNSTAKTAQSKIAEAIAN